MNDWIKAPRYGEVTMSWEATPEDYALFSWMFPEPRVKRPMACLAPVDTTARLTKETQHEHHQGDYHSRGRLTTSSTE